MFEAYEKYHYRISSLQLLRTFSDGRYITHHKLLRISGMWVSFSLSPLVLICFPNKRISIIYTTVSIIYKDVQIPFLLPRANFVANIFHFSERKVLWKSGEQIPTVTMNLLRALLSALSFQVSTMNEDALMHRRLVDSAQVRNLRGHPMKELVALDYV